MHSLASDDIVCNAMVLWFWSSIYATSSSDVTELIFGIISCNVRCDVVVVECCCWNSFLLGRSVKPRQLPSAFSHEFNPTVVLTLRTLASEFIKSFHSSTPPSALTCPFKIINRATTTVESNSSSSPMKKRSSRSLTVLAALLISYINYCIPTIQALASAAPFHSTEAEFARRKRRTMTVGIPHHGAVELDTSMPILKLPAWVEETRDDLGTPIAVHEWDDKDSYRTKNGWQGSDLVHDRHAPVRILEYFVKYGPGMEAVGLTSGGAGTTLIGIVHFTKRAESHKGYCHGGSMCSLMDDIIGWGAFMTTGSCRPWSGFTVQVNTSLQKPIRVDSFLLVKATITKVERRKVSISAVLIDPAEEAGEDNNENIHATGEGLVVLNKGVLPEQPSP